MGRGSTGSDNANREAYLHLSVTVLATFARVPQIAATDEMQSKVPLILEIMSKEYVFIFSLSLCFSGWVLDCWSIPVGTLNFNEVSILSFQLSLCSDFYKFVVIFRCELIQSLH